MATSNNPFDLTGRVGLITGSSRGIGLALAQALGRAGATVVLNARMPDPLVDAARQLSDEGVTVHTHAADVTDAEAVEAMVASIEQNVGPIDILINNAGAQYRAPFLEFPIDALTSVLEVNLIAPFVVAQAAARHMVPRGRGKIINICSVMSKLARPTITPYTASKGGLKMMTQGLCADLAPLGLQVNAIAPGYFKTELNQALVDDPEFSAWVEQRTPAARWGEVDELGGAAVFLASSAADFVNGQTLFVDGGMTAVV